MTKRRNFRWIEEGQVVRVPVVSLRAALVVAMLLALTSPLAAQSPVVGQADIPGAHDLPPAVLAGEYLSRGLNQAALGQREEALVELTLAINQHALAPSEQARALYNRGLLLEEMGQTRHAAGDYAGALLLDPGLEDASARLNALNQLLPPATQMKPRKSDAADVPPVSVSLGLKPAIAEGSPKDGEEVQLGAWRTEAEAKEKWNEFSMRAGEILSAFTPNIFEADVPGKGRYFRLRLGPMDKNAAAQLCRELRAQALACISAKSF